MEILTTLFGNRGRVRLLRYFLGRSSSVSLSEIKAISKLPARELSKELKALLAIGFLKKTSRTEKAKNGKKVKADSYLFDQRFLLAEPLRELFVKAITVTDSNLLNRLRKVGQLQLVVMAGHLVGTTDSDIDLLLVIEKAKKRELERALAMIEDEIGREIAYVLFTKEEYVYRKAMNDRVLRDIFDHTHKVLFEKKSLS